MVPVHWRELAATREIWDLFAGWLSMHASGCMNRSDLLPGYLSCSLTKCGFNLVYCCWYMPSVLWSCWLGGRKGIQPIKKLEWWGVSCFSKIQIGFTFLVLAHPGSPGKRADKRVCVCVLLLLIYWCISFIIVLQVVYSVLVLSHLLGRMNLKWPIFEWD